MLDNERFKNIYKRKVQITNKQNNNLLPVQWSTKQSWLLKKKQKKKSKKVLHESAMHHQCIDIYQKIKKIKSPIRFYSPLFQVLILGFVAVLHDNSWGKWWILRLWCCNVKVLPSYYRPTLHLHQQELRLEVIILKGWRTSFKERRGSWL